MRDVAGVEVTPEEEKIVHAALLAQVDDVHAGGVYSLEEQEVDQAEVLYGRFNALGTPEGDAVALSLAYLAFEIDHIDLTEAQWNAAERLFAELATTWGC